MLRAEYFSPEAADWLCRICRNVTDHCKCRPVAFYWTHEGFQFIASIELTQEEVERRFGRSTRIGPWIEAPDYLIPSDWRGVKCEYTAVRSGQRRIAGLAVRKVENHEQR